MATWNRLVSGSTAGNISLNIDYGIASVTRTSNTNVRVVYGIRFAMSGSTYTFNSIAAFCPAGGTRYFAFNSGSGAKHTNSGTWYYANTSGSTTTSEKTPFTQDITVTVTQTSASFEVGYGWDAWTPSQKGKSTITVTFPTGATAPTGCWCSVSNVTETSCTLSGGYGSNGNATVTASGYQYKKDGGSWTNCSATLTGLTENTKYYFRYYATNSQGTSYSDGTTNATTYYFPHATTTPNFTIGDPLWITLYNPLGRDCHITMFGTDESKICEGGGWTGTSIGDFNYDDIKNNLYKSIPSAKQGTYHIRITSMGVVRDKRNAGTYYVRGTETPTFTNSNITNIADTLHVNDITGNSSKIIKGHNKITGNITKMTPNYSANGNKYVVNASGTPNTQEIPYDAGATKTFTIDNVTTNSVSVTAYDTRTLFTAATKNFDLIDYNSPKIDEVNITRLNGLGEYVNVNAKGTFTNWSGWNEIKKYNSILNVYIRFKKSTETSFGNYKDLKGLLTKNTNGTWEVNGTLDVAFDVTEKYNIELYVVDVLETSHIVGATLSTANGFLWRDLKNKRIGINKKPEHTLDVGGSLNIDGDLYIKGVKVIWDE